MDMSPQGVARVTAPELSDPSHLRDGTRKRGCMSWWRITTASLARESKIDGLMTVRECYRHLSVRDTLVLIFVQHMAHAYINFSHF